MIHYLKLLKNIMVIKDSIILSYKQPFYIKIKNAFVRSNPNFMYAKKNLYLPSINEIKELVYKDKKKLPK